MNEQRITVKSAMRERLIGLLQKPVQEQKEKKPHNKRWLAFLGFNFAMFFIDVVSAITVGSIVNPMYGIMTFLAGFLALIIHEQLFTNPHFNLQQKLISVGGMVTAIFATLGIGILAAIVNVTKVIGTMISVTDVELIIAIALVAFTIFHGLLWGVSYFMDSGHRSEMSALVSLAYREQQLKDFANAKKDVLSVKALSTELDAMGEDEAELTQLSYKQHTGQDLVQKQPAPETAGQVLRPVALQPSPMPGVIEYANKPAEVKDSDLIARLRKERLPAYIAPAPFRGNGPDEEYHGIS